MERGKKTSVSGAKPQGRPVYGRSLVIEDVRREKQTIRKKRGGCREKPEISRAHETEQKLGPGMNEGEGSGVGRETGNGSKGEGGGWGFAKLHYDRRYSMEPARISTSLVLVLFRY